MKHHKLSLLLTATLALPLAFLQDSAWAEKKLPEAQQNLRSIQQEIIKLQPEYERLKGQNKILERELSNLSERLVIISDQINNSQNHIDLLEQTIKQYDAEEQALAASLQTRRSETAKVLSAMGRLSLAPKSPLGATEDEAKTIQTALVLRSLTDSLKSKADILVSDMDRLQQMRDDLKKQRTALGTEKLSLNSDKQRLEILLEARKKRFEESNEGLEERQAYMEKLSKKERNITGLIEKIQAEEKRLIAQQQQERMAMRRRRHSDKTSSETVELASLGTAKSSFYGRGKGGVLSSRAFQAEKGKLVMPASGKILYGFGSRDMTGQKRQGITVKTRASSLVTAPSQGRVVFVGKFLEYGHMVIIKPTEGYSILVAGMGKTNVTLHQNLLKGEPIGKMPDGKGYDNILLEMRHNGKTINPSQWLKKMSHLASAKRN